jgi:D-alanine-D-alanine ligase
MADYAVVMRREWRAGPERVLADLEGRFSYPLFVKPANLGSSVGVSKAHGRGELQRGLDLAARFDRKLLVEVAINAREIECSVLGNDHPKASLPGEVIPYRDFYDYRDKYIDNKTTFRIPADLPSETVARVRRLAVEAYRAVECSGLARLDFFLEKNTGELFVNEINTIPGFTEISMYPKLWDATGLPFGRLIEELVRLGFERHRLKKRAGARPVR